MSSPIQRTQMAHAIVDFEARRDSKGHLMVYNLPSSDGGGRYEVAGINERYDKPICDKLVQLIRSGQYNEAEQVATEYIAKNTDPAAKITAVPSLECYLRDIVFNRGLVGCVKTLQHALRMRVVDGVITPNGPTQHAMADAQKDAATLLIKLRAAREWYERNVVGRDEGSIFWRGLVNRWNNSLATAKTFPNTIPDTIAVPLVTVPETPPPAAVKKLDAHQQSWWLDGVLRGNFSPKQILSPDTVAALPKSPIIFTPPKPRATSDALIILGDRVKRTMLAKSYPWFDEQNVTSIEGMDPNGIPNQNRPNAFDDVKMILNGAGKIIAGPFQGTTQPGKFWTRHRMNPKGAFIIALGPQRVWTPGPYHGFTVWRQAEDSHIMGFRDDAEDYTRHGEPIDCGDIGVHHHGGYNLPRDDIGRAAAGCQVIEFTESQAIFMKMTLACSRFRKDGLTATVLRATDLLP